MTAPSNLAIYGGTPTRLEPWPQYIHGTGDFPREVFDAVGSVLKSGRLFRYDTRSSSETATGKLEESLCQYFGSKYALAVSSGTAALALAIMALDLPAGSEVACPAFGFPATASAVLLAGCIPRVFAVDDNLHFDIEDLQRRWTSEVRAVIVVHMRGSASPVDKIVDFARSRNVSVIEDAVPALGCRLHGKLLGTFGKVGCFSTQSDKMINTGEGGFLITDSEAIIERAIILSGAFEGRYLKHLKQLKIVESEFCLPLFNFRIDEVRSAIALAQLPGVDAKARAMRENYDYVVDRIETIEGLRIRKSIEPKSYIGDSLVFFVDLVRAQFVADALVAEGISARSLGSSIVPNVRAFWQWHFIERWNENLRMGGIEALRPSASMLRSAIDVPLSCRLTKRDMDDLVIALKKIFDHASVPEASEV